MPTIAPGAVFALPDGRLVRAHRDADVGGIALLTLQNTQEFVVRASWTGGRPCLALVMRVWPPGAPLSEPTYVPTDFTLADLTPLAP